MEAMKCLIAHPPLTAVALHCPAWAGRSALPQATEAWAQNDVFPHLKATGVFMRPSRGERHYMCEAGGVTAAGQREPAAYPGADATLS